MNRLQVLQTRAVEAGFEILTPTSSLTEAWGSSAVDLIVAFDVVEHMTLCAIRSFLAEAKAALKPGGLLLLHTPVATVQIRLFGYLLGRRHAPYAAGLQRLYGSSHPNWIWKSGRSGHRVLPMTGLSKTRLVRRAAVRFCRWTVFSFIRTALMGNVNAILTPNMIVVLARTTGGRTPSTPSARWERTDQCDVRNSRLRLVVAAEA